MFKRKIPEEKAGIRLNLNKLKYQKEIFFLSFCGTALLLLNLILQLFLGFSLWYSIVTVICLIIIANKLLKTRIDQKNNKSTSTIYLYDSTKLFTGLGGSLEDEQYVSTAEITHNKTGSKDIEGYASVQEEIHVNDTGSGTNPDKKDNTKRNLLSKRKAVLADGSANRANKN